MRLAYVDFTALDIQKGSDKSLDDSGMPCYGIAIAGNSRVGSCQIRADGVWLPLFTGGPLIFGRPLRESLLVRPLHPASGRLLVMIAENPGELPTLEANKARHWHSVYEAINLAIGASAQWYFSMPRNAYYGGGQAALMAVSATGLTIQVDRVRTAPDGTYIGDYSSSVAYLGPSAVAAGDSSQSWTMGLEPCASLKITNASGLGPISMTLFAALDV